MCENLENHATSAPHNYNQGYSTSAPHNNYPNNNYWHSTTSAPHNHNQWYSTSAPDNNYPNNNYWHSTTSAPHNHNQWYSTSAPGGSLEDPPAMICDYCEKYKQTFDRAKCENLCYPANGRILSPAQDLLIATSIACVKTWKIMRLRHRTITTNGTVRRRRTITTQTTTIGTARLGHRTITTNGTVRRRRTIGTAIGPNNNYWHSTTWAPHNHNQWHSTSAPHNNYPNNNYWHSTTSAPYDQSKNNDGSACGEGTKMEDGKCVINYSGLKEMCYMASKNDWGWTCKSLSQCPAPSPFQN